MLSSPGEVCASFSCNFHVNSDILNHDGPDPSLGKHLSARHHCLCSLRDRSGKFVC